MVGGHYRVAPNSQRPTHDPYDKSLELFNKKNTSGFHHTRSEGRAVRLGFDFARVDVQVATAAVPSTVGELKHASSGSANDPRYRRSSSVLPKLRGPNERNRRTSRGSLSPGTRRYKYATRIDARRTRGMRVKGWWLGVGYIFGNSIGK